MLDVVADLQVYGIFWKVVATGKPGYKEALGPPLTFKLPRKAMSF